MIFVVLLHGYVNVDSPFKLWPHSIFNITPESVRHVPPDSLCVIQNLNDKDEIQFIVQTSLNNNKEVF